MALAGLAVIANQIRSFIQGFRESPPPSERYQTKQDCQRLHTEALERLRRTEERIDASHVSREDDRKDLRKELTEFREESGRALRDVHARIDDLPSQIITILRNTGAIK